MTAEQRSNGAGGALGDFVRVAARLQADEETARRIARCLQFELGPERERGEEPPPSDAAPPDDRLRQDDTPPTRDDFEPQPDLPPGAQARKAAAAGDREPAPRRPGDAVPVPADPPDGWTPEGGGLPARPPHQPLFSPIRQRVLLRGTVDGWVPTGRVDMARLIAWLAARKPILAVPRRLRRAAPKGVDVLVHASDGMMPFRRDQRELSTALRRLVGVAEVRVWWFRSDPAELWDARVEAEDAYRPHSGRPTLILSDGVLPSADHERAAAAWSDLGVRLRAAGSEAALLTPYGEATPAAAAAGLVTIAWDRGTTLRMIRRARRRRR